MCVLFSKWNILFAIIFWVLPMPASAHLSANPMPLPAVIEQSDRIFDADIINFKSDNSNNSAPTSADYLSKSKGLTAGMYSLKIRTNIKGDGPSTVKIVLPELLPENYGASEYKPMIGGHVILFLKHDDNGGWSLTEPLTPLIPLDGDAKIEDVHGSAYAGVEHLLIASMKNVPIRLMTSFFLRFFDDSSIYPTMVRYANDENLYVRDNVIAWLLANQHVEAIPMAASLERTLFATEFTTGNSAQCLAFLKKVRDPKAVSYLNPLLFEYSEYTRINDMVALATQGNRTSIPYLIIALQDPDWQQYIPFAAFKALHKLVPELGYDKLEENQFNLHQNEVIQSVYKWWAGQLSSTDGSPSAIAKFLRASASDTMIMNGRLFSTSTAERSKALDDLQKEPNRNVKIGLTILALHDPQQSISYQAYRYLSTSISSLANIATEAEFNANRAEAIKRANSWWRDEMNGKHQLLK